VRRKEKRREILPSPLIPVVAKKKGALGRAFTNLGPLFSMVRGEKRKERFFPHRRETKDPATRGRGYRRRIQDGQKERSYPLLCGKGGKKKTDITSGKTRRAAEKKKNQKFITSGKKKRGERESRSV